MTSPPRMFDRDLLLRRRARARAQGGADFLHEAVAVEMSERLEEVNRTFRRAAVVTSNRAVWEKNFDSAGFDEFRIIDDDEVLKVDEGSCDLVIHALALHWANDPVGQLVQAKRALVPDGLLLAAMFGGESLHELRACFAEAEIEILGGLSPRVAPMGEIRDLGGLLQRAGLALPVADSHALTVRYGSALHLMRDLRAMGETNVMVDRHRRPLRRSMLMRVAEIYAERFGGEDGLIPATFELVYLTGWSPSPDQQKPLRPGSAAGRLADALGVPELSAGEKAGKGS
ncbi:methyltransferase domain-containing protein [Amaricoccus tamworthensis]|uniref:methyltransferase domain-containing protein n=1 Tax=Amaricoccus tamworthensis TaxID=57002 RepID=UPI003C7BB490